MRTHTTHRSCAALLSAQEELNPQPFTPMLLAASLIGCVSIPLLLLLHYRHDRDRRVLLALCDTFRVEDSEAHAQADGAEYGTFVAAKA